MATRAPTTSRTAQRVSLREGEGGGLCAGEGKVKGRYFVPRTPTPPLHHSTTTHTHICTAVACGECEDDDDGLFAETSWQTWTDTITLNVEVRRVHVVTVLTVLTVIWVALDPSHTLIARACTTHSQVFLVVFMIVFFFIVPKATQEAAFKALSFCEPAGAVRRALKYKILICTGIGI